MRDAGLIDQDREVVRPFSDEHPLTMVVSSRTTASWTDARTVEFTLARRDWFVHTVRAGRQPVVVTPEDSSLSVGTLASLRAAGGDWLLAGPTGLRSLGGAPAKLDGWRPPAAPATSVSDDPSSSTARTPVMPADGVSAAPVADVVPAVQFILSVHRRAEASTMLGSEVTLSLGEDPSWGLFEPCTRPWNAVSLTELVRRRMPDQTRFFVRGEFGAAAVMVRRSQFGVVEEVKSVLPLTSHERINETLRTLAEKEDILFASAWSCSARADGTLGIELGHGLRPLGFAVGPRVLRRSGWSPDVGRARVQWVGQRARQRTLVVNLSNANDDELATVADSAMRGTPLAGLLDGALQ